MDVLPYYFGRVKMIFPEVGTSTSLTETVRVWEVSPAMAELEEI